MTIEYVENMDEKPKTDPLKVVSVRFDHQLLPIIEQAAQDDDRDISSFVRHVMKEWLKQAGYLPNNKATEKPTEKKTKHRHKNVVSK